MRRICSTIENHDDDGSASRANSEAEDCAACPSCKFENPRPGMCLHPQPRILAARERHIEKLRRGNWTGARKELAVWSSEVATSVTRDRQLKVNVLSRLTAEQRRRLESRVPGVYAAPWKPRSRWGTQQSAKS